MKNSEDIVEEMIAYHGTKKNGLIFMSQSDVAPCLIEEYCEARIREGNYDGECVGETGVNDMLLSIIGDDMDQDACYEFIDSIKSQMIQYYSDELDESIEKNLMAVNFPEDEEAAPPIGWSAIYTLDNPPEIERV